MDCFETRVDTQSSQLGQAKTNCQSALAYIDAIAFDPTPIEKGIITALRGWKEDVAKTSGLDGAPVCSGLAEEVQEILKALQTNIRS